MPLKKPNASMPSGKGAVPRTRPALTAAAEGRDEDEEEDGGAGFVRGRGGGRASRGRGARERRLTSRHRGRIQKSSVDAPPRSLYVLDCDVLTLPVVAALSTMFIAQMAAIFVGRWGVCVRAGGGARACCEQETRAKVLFFLESSDFTVLVRFRNPVLVARRHFAASWREKCKYVSEICFLSTWPRERASFANSQCVTRAKTKKMPR